MITNKIKKVFYKIKCILLPIRSKPPFAVIFLYHTIEDSPNPWTIGHRYPTPYDIFKRQINFINSKFKIVRTSEIIKRLESGELKQNVAAIHFDDGFKSYFKLALPYFIKYNIPSSIFLINSVLEGDIPIRNKIAYCMNTGAKFNILNRTNEYLQERGYNDVDILKMDTSKFLSWIKNRSDNQFVKLLNDEYKLHVIGKKLQSPFIDVEELKSFVNNPLIEFGSHTLNHKMLYNLNKTEQRREILDGHNKLENILGKKVNLFAYPFGGNNHFDDTSKKIVYDCGRLYAFSTYGGINYTLGRADLKRITLTDHTPIRIKTVLNNEISKFSSNKS